MYSFLYTVVFLVFLGVVKLETEVTELQTQLTKSTSELENLKSETVKQAEAEAKKMQESTKQQVNYLIIKVLGLVRSVHKFRYIMLLLFIC